MEDLKVERKMALEQRERLKRMNDEKDKFCSDLSASRMSVYEVQFCLNM